MDPRILEIETRLKEISVEIDKEDIDLDALETEINELKEERSKIQTEMDDEFAKVEKRKEMAKNIEDGKAEYKVVEERKEIEPMTKEVVYTSASPEYRSAFLKTLLREDLTDIEQRAFVHTTDNTGAVVPEETLNRIYSNMEEAHPILRDVQVLRTGTVITIAKHTAIVAGDAAQVAEGVANDDEENTFVNVTLSGKDFSKHVDFSYRLGKMAIPAFEDYLVKEIGDRLGAAMAADIVTQIKADLAVANSIDAETPGTLVIKDITNGLATLKSVGRVYVYANNATFYGDIANMTDADTKLSFIPNYQEAIAGQVLGKAIKEEAALADGEILILDPNQFIYNMVQDVMLERDRDIKTHVHTISGFAIAEGSMTNDKAGALITVGTAQ